MSHQYVRTVSVTQPLYDDISEEEGFIEFPQTPEELVSYVARVSNPSNQHNFKSSTGLIQYLMRNKHWSPFEMVDITLEINTTRDIGRQILRHRSFVFQEFSQRYADATKELGFAPREARLQDNKNRQNSIYTDDEDLKVSWEIKQQQIIHEAKLAYWWAIENNIAKEQARSVLPEGNTMSRMYMKGSLRSWLHYIELRSANGTQKEHQEIALLCAEKVVKYFPFLKEWYDNIKTKQDAVLYVFTNKEIPGLGYPWVTAFYDTKSDLLRIYSDRDEILFECFYGLGIDNKDKILEYLKAEIGGFVNENDHSNLKFQEMTEGYKING